MFKKIVERASLDPNSYGLHSLRSGGASLAAHEGVPRELIQRHGRWKDAASLQTYINPSDQVKFDVTRKMFRSAQISELTPNPPSPRPSTKLRDKLRQALNFQSHIFKITSILYTTKS